MIFLVGVGGVFGAVLRFLLGDWISSKTTKDFPFATWVINISGSFILGILIVLYVEGAISEWLWLVFGVGFLGSYTTFSTFGYETILLLQQKEVRKAVIYVTSSIILGVVFAWIGGVLGGSMT